MYLMGCYGDKVIGVRCQLGLTLCSSISLAPPSHTLTSFVVLIVVFFLYS
jgi:hypothetical protein